MDEARAIEDAKFILSERDRYAKHGVEFPLWDAATLVNMSEVILTRCKQDVAARHDE